MAAFDVAQLGDRLDQDHLPETNGRMAICRRCGATTDGSKGFHHVPRDHEVARSGRWLDQQARLINLDQARTRMS